MKFVLLSMQAVAFAMLVGLTAYQIEQGESAWAVLAGAAFVLPYAIFVAVVAANDPR